MKKAKFEFIEEHGGEFGVSAIRRVLGASRQDSHEDLVGRGFTADCPNETWFADITYVRTHQGWPCLAIVMDVWTRIIVGWSMGPRITAEPADDALGTAIARRRPAEGCLHHSDRGAQYVSLLLGKTM